MIHSPQEAANDLVFALTEAAGVCTLQRERAIVAREAAERDHQQFLSLLTAQQSDAAETEARQQRRRYFQQMQEKHSLGTTQAQISDAAALNARQVQSLGDSQIALMRLYAFPEAREAADHIAALLQSVLMIRAGDRKHILPTPPSTQIIEAIHSGQDQQSRKVSMALDFMRGMEGYREQVIQSYQEDSSHTTTLLEQSREAAVALAMRLSASPAT